MPFPYSCQFLADTLLKCRHYVIMDARRTVFKYFSDRTSRTVKSLSVLISVLLFILSCGASAQIDEIIRITAEGTSEELLDIIKALNISDVSTIRLGRNYSLMHVAIGNESHPEVINVLYEFGGDVNAQDDDLRTPLDYAVDNDTPEAARILLELGANPLLRNGSGVHVLDSCRNVVLRDFPNHNTCKTILDLVGR